MYRIAAGRWRIDLHADFVGALLMIRNYYGPEADFDPGLGTGVRVGARLRAVTPFLGVSFVGWLRRQEVNLSSPPIGTDLPRLELMFTAGVAYVRE
jgi:hypothetical protein